MAEPVPGIVVVDKPSDWTSHDVVARLRRLAGTRKVGHAGTLDPMATGVLVAGVGRATRLLGHLTLTEKEYVATVRLGQVTTTDDAEGETVTTTPVGALDRARVEAARDAFVGEIEQVPSSVSAIKVGGVRSYARVRAGEQVELASRRVTVSAFDVHDLRPAAGPGGEAFLDVDVRVVCSSGTYVRALARDLGAALDVGGHLTALRRTRVGPFGLDDARTLDQHGDALVTVGIDEVARRVFPVVALDADDEERVRHGRALPGLVLGEDGPTALTTADGTLLALYGPAPDGARAVAVFV